MTSCNRFFIAFLCFTLTMVYPLMSQADMQQGYGNVANTPPVTPMAAEQQHSSSYGQKIGRKASVAFANLIASPLEVPKNIINTLNQSNFFYGFVGGSLKGLVNTIGRTVCGLVDLITLPIPTKPVAYPLYVWDDFDVDTSYGDTLRLNKTPGAATKK